MNAALLYVALKSTYPQPKKKARDPKRASPEQLQKQQIELESTAPSSRSQQGRWSGLFPIWIPLQVVVNAISAVSQTPPEAILSPSPISLENSPGSGTAPT